MNRRTPLYLAAALSLALSAGAVYFIGKQSGHRTGEQAKTRLELVWPSLMTLPTTDRALLAGFSMTCRMESRAKEADDVIGCLREAAGNPDAIRPKEMGQAEAAARLETLITQALEK